MVTNPRILEALRKKEREFTLMFDSAGLRRSVFYFWDSSDIKAADYCDKLSGLEFGRAIPIRLTSEITIENWLQTYIERMKGSQNPIQHKVYCLFVSSSVGRFDGKALMEASSEFVELYYQLIFLGTELPEDAGENCFGASWIVRPDDYLTARILLADASFTYEWISPGNWGFAIGGGWYRLRATRYSSVGDDICGQLYHRLSPVFRNEDDDVLNAKMHEFYNAMFNRLNEIYLNCPHIKYLPLIGYHELNQKLFGRSGTWRIGRFSRGTAGRILNSDAISILFGKEHEMPRPEWMREQIVQRYLPSACADSVSKYEKEIRDQLFQRFTLSDLYNKIARIALNKSNEKHNTCYQIETGIQDALNKYYAAEGSEPKDIWNGLNSYMKSWDNYLQQSLISVWWSEISKYVVKLSNNCKDDFIALKQAYIDFEDYKDNTAQNAVIPLNSIRRFSDLLKAIELSSAVTSYTGEMLEPLRRRAAVLHLATGDDVASEHRPKIGLLLSDTITKETGMIYDEFEWRNHPRDYMPSNVIYELRMYQEKV